MACEQETKFPLRLLVDNERNHVVVAEASGDFINILLSFLTLPLGTIIRLVSEKQQHLQPKEIGCINNLYRSVENLGVEVFWNHIFKRMLLYPRNPCEAFCQKLKLNVDITEPTKYFLCRSCSYGSDPLLSTFAGANCSCGKLMDFEIKLLEEDSHEETLGDGVFVKGETMYLIFDDLKVFPSSPCDFVQQVSQLGYKNFNKLTEVWLNAGLKEVLDLLKQALTSKSPLDDVFLANGESKQTDTFSPKFRPRNECCNSNCVINLKITVRKSKKKILYAVAEGDFIDFLFSLLAAPLGSLLKLLDGYSSVGCMNNLYSSVKDLNASGTPILDLRVAPQFGCGRLPIQLCEEDNPTYWFGTEVMKNNTHYLPGKVSKEKNLIKNSSAMRLFDPRSPNGTKEAIVGFVRKPSLFVVGDDLQVTPLANTSSISLLQKMNVPLDDLEVHSVSIGETEALNLLGASLTSKAALTEGLFYLLKKPKEETTSAFGQRII